MWWDPVERIYRNQAKCVQCAAATHHCTPGNDCNDRVRSWTSLDGVHWTQGRGWGKGIKGRLDDQELVIYDPDASAAKPYSFYSRANSANDVSTSPLGVRRFSAAHGDGVWQDEVVLSGLFPDAIDESTHPYPWDSTWTRLPVMVGSSVIWKLKDTVPPTYLAFLDDHWMWTMSCWKNNKGCDHQYTHEGCGALAPEEPCQAVDIRLASSRDGVTFIRRNSTPDVGGRCVGMCDPEARRALISGGMEGGWYSRGLWTLPSPVLTSDEKELRVFFHGTNVDNRGRVDPQARPPYSPPPGALKGGMTEGIGFASFRPDGLLGLRAPYGAQGEATTIPLTFSDDVSQLELNMDSGVGGVLRVEIQDATTGHPIPGWTLNDSTPLTRNSLSAIVTWRTWKRPEGSKLPPLAAGQSVLLRFLMEDTWLYSFRFRGVKI